ncbi:MAG: CHASE domain-containing protein [Planctomycetota bacterium]
MSHPAPPLHRHTEDRAADTLQTMDCCTPTYAGRHWPRVAAVAVLLIGIGLTGLGVHHELAAAHSADQHRFNRLSENLRSELTRRVMVYDYGLQGARSLYPASQSVERHEFRAMVESRDLANNFPGALGIGFIRRVEDDEQAIASFLEQTRSEGAPEFEITVPQGAGPMPGSVMDDRFIIEFIEPIANNRPAQGLDIGSHPVRREAAERATLTGLGSITGRLDLVQDDQQFAGFLYLLPVYAKGMPSSTADERIAATVGWVYMPIIAPPVLAGAAQAANHEISFEVYDGDQTLAENQIYNDNHANADTDVAPAAFSQEANPRLYIEKPLDIGGRTWTVTIHATESFKSASRATAWLVGLSGGLLSLILGLLMFSQGSATRRAFGLAEGMTRDLRRYAHAADAATRAKSAFLANMSHEIRTPMTAILGYADLLCDDPDAHRSHSKRLEYIGTIKRNGNHLLSIINDILDISKIEAGKLSVETIDTDPEALIHDVVSLMAVKADMKGLTITTRFETEIPKTIQSDPVRLRQILVNLVGNAIKFTHQGGVTLTIGFDAEKQVLTCAIADTGIGMTPNQIDRLFGAFEQADPSTTRVYGGSGLGLQISRRLAGILGGEISVTSEPGVGSVFTVSVLTNNYVGVETLPAKSPVVLRETVGNEPYPPTSNQPLRGLRILFAEDGEDNQRLIGFHLKKAGATVTLVENGRLAVQALSVDGTLEGPIASNPPFDLMLTDMQMPEMDGYTAVRLLRKKGANLPIVALTAHAMSSDADLCLEAGCDDYASKPIDRARLIEICADAVSRGSSHGAAA